MTSNTNSNPSLSGAGTFTPQGPSKANPASASTSASSQSQTQPLYPGLGANFAHNPQGPGPYTVNYDQEAYLQYMADEEAAALAAEGGSGTAAGTGPDTKKTKTPKQIYREVR